MSQAKGSEEKITDRAYGLLKRYGKMRGSDLGWMLWGETTESAARGVGSHGHNKFCRSAGKVLKRLEAEGRATWSTVRGSGSGYVLWEAI